MNGLNSSFVLITLSIILYLTGRTFAGHLVTPASVRASIGYSLLVWILLLIMGPWIGIDDAPLVPVTAVFFFFGLTSIRTGQDHRARQSDRKLVPQTFDAETALIQTNAGRVSPQTFTTVVAPESVTKAAYKPKLTSQVTTDNVHGPRVARKPKPMHTNSSALGPASLVPPREKSGVAQPLQLGSTGNATAATSGIEFGTMDLSPEAMRVIQVVNDTNRCVFVTGYAGTGKSTLLRYIVSTTTKQVAVLAPTGIAAINARGQTIHSFCGFPPHIINPKEIEASAKGELCRRLDAIIIDEISMVRADLMDCIDAFLRVNRQRLSDPFGGLQLIFFGDLLQLPPVVTEKDQEYVSAHYRSPFFFDAHVFDGLHMEVIQLTKIYRQQDPLFIDILNGVRAGTLADANLRALNQRYNPTFQPQDGHGYVLLVSTNKQADGANRDQLAKLPGEEITYEGSIVGNFDEKAAPTDLVLHLKKGAQVMFVKNDPEHRWVNGTTGKISDLDDKTIQVAITGGASHTESVYEVAPETWETIEYIFDPVTRDVKTEVTGSLKQYPLKLAWAMTIHKSQGKTFENAIVDFGRGTFADGQAYVALSRCKSLEGLVLKVPFKLQDVRVSREALAFMRDCCQDMDRSRIDVTTGISEFARTEQAKRQPRATTSVHAVSGQTAEKPIGVKPEFTKIIGSAKRVWINPSGGTVRTDTCPEGKEVDTAALIRWLREQGWDGGGDGRNQIAMWKR